MWRDSSAVKFDRVEIAFILSMFDWLKPLTNEGGEETELQGENPWQQASENARGIAKFIWTEDQCVMFGTVQEA